MSTPAIEIVVAADEAGERLDRLVARRLDVPRNQIRQWIRDGRVMLRGQAAKPSHPVAADDVIELDPPVRDLARDLEPETGEISILYEDVDLVAVDKPVDLVVHPGAGRDRGTLVHRLLGRYPEISEVGGPGRPGIVHRLDKDTSGVILIARSQRAYRALTAAFAERRVDKRYLALVYGSPEPAVGLIDAPVGRHPTRRKEMAIRQDGRPAVTHYRTLGGGSGISALELGLETGRTHQIRVHLKALGRPLIGDPVYGEARWKGLPKAVQKPLREFPRPALHAWRLELQHPITEQMLALEAPLPEDLRLLWQGVTGSEFPAPAS